MTTVRDATFDVLRRSGGTTLYGNPGSTEISLLTDLPEDLTFILALHEGSVVGMASGAAIDGGRPSVVIRHRQRGDRKARLRHDQETHRAGILEHGSVRMLVESGVSDRVLSDGYRLDGPDGFQLKRGNIVDKVVLRFRSDVCEPMRYGNLFLAGDAAHTVPPTGAKGLTSRSPTSGCCSRASTPGRRPGRGSCSTSTASEPAESGRRRTSPTG